ncbi:MAG: hypothetical protein EOP59_06155 [Sphingomonadales bacterium]|nr:MAG: hypothetical protein EOP59_06155 [Sphingomonadales bacterium]
MRAAISRRLAIGGGIQMDSEEVSHILKEASTKLTENGLDASLIKPLRNDALLNEVIGKWPPSGPVHFTHGGATELAAHANRLSIAGLELFAAGEPGIAGQITELAEKMTLAAGIVGPWPQEGGD